VDATSRAFPEFLEGIPDAIVAADTEGVIRYVNEHMLTLFGYARDAVIGHNVEMLVPDRIKAAHPHHRAIYALNPVKRPMGAGLQLSARNAKGIEFPVDISLSTVTIDNQTIVLAAIRDMTDRKQYETTLITDLIASIAELRESVLDLTKSVAAEKKKAEDQTDVRDKQRRRDWRVNGALLLIIVLVGAGGLYTQRSARSACRATNSANTTVHDLFTPLNKFVPTPIPAGATPAEIAVIHHQDAVRKAQADAFFADLNARTKPKKC
jgi:PAS domain S-box-containing protein